MSRRIDRVPPDGWVTKLRVVFGISEDATWSDILIECSQTKRLADRVARDYMKTQTTPKAAAPRVMQHGRDCPKVAHIDQRCGYLHGPDDDRPYDVDGVNYCGRCHGWMEVSR